MFSPKNELRSKVILAEVFVYSSKRNAEVLVVSARIWTLSARLKMIKIDSRRITSSEEQGTIPMVIFYT